MRNFVVECWDGVMDYRFNPLKHIPDLQVRHMMLQVLAWLWCIAFSLYFTSWGVFGFTFVAHFILILAIVVTVATFNRAKQAPYSFVNGYHSVNRTRAYIWSNGKKVKLDESDPGGEHE